jgi:arylsulfatase
MPDRPPNIVYILHDNTGCGDWGVYGGNVATPRIDKFASEGIRFNNYTVEAQCTPTRSAILTGRLPSRAGTYAVPLPGQGAYGLCPWEYTIAELLSDAGYATSMWGKWHLGEVDGRLPNDKGFDECWFEKNTTDEAGYTSYALFHTSWSRRSPAWKCRNCGRGRRARRTSPSKTST